MKSYELSLRVMKSSGHLGAVRRGVKMGFHSLSNIEQLRILSLHSFQGESDIRISFVRNFFEQLGSQTFYSLERLRNHDWVAPCEVLTLRKMA